jgi:transposase
MPIPLRTDFDAARLRAAARQTTHAGQARRLLALASVYEGSTRTEAAKIGCVSLQIVRDWVLMRPVRGWAFATRPRGDSVSFLNESARHGLPIDWSREVGL